MDGVFIPYGPFHASSPLSTEVCPTPCHVVQGRTGRVFLRDVCLGATVGRTGEGRLIFLDSGPGRGISHSSLRGRLCITLSGIKEI